MTRAEIDAAAKRMCEDNPALLSLWGAGWARVYSHIERRALKKRPRPKDFEVHHEVMVGKEAFISALIGGSSMADAESNALQRVGITRSESAEGGPHG